MSTPLRLFIVDDEAPARARLITLLSDIASECPHTLVGQAATAQDYTQAQAFQNLLQGLNTQAPAMVINPSTANQAGTYTVPSLPNVNNQALAGDIQAGFQSVPANVAAHPYNQYLDLLAALQRYQGLPSTGGVWGSGYSGTNDIYGNPIPTIA